MSENSTTQEPGEEKTDECAYCKSLVSERATKCPYCLAGDPVNRVSHGGVCPSCRISINETAIRCLHCKSWIPPNEETAPFREMNSEISGLFAHGQSGLIEYSHCEWVDDWRTVDIKRKTVFMRYECINSTTGRKKVMGGRERRISEAEIQEWKLKYQ